MQILHYVCEAVSLPLVAQLGNRVTATCMPQDFRNHPSYCLTPYIRAVPTDQ